VLARLGKLMGGSATLWVGASTEVIMKRRVEVAQRTASAMRLALEEGVAPGGGVALLSTRQALRDRLAQAEEVDERAAYEILLKAAEAPLRTIAANAGYDACEVMSDLRLAGPGHGLDVMSGEVFSVRESHLYDPAGVVKAALFGAVKTAALALTVDVIVHHAEPERAQPLRPVARMKL
jgi:chaperonin GroEL